MRTFSFSFFLIFIVLSTFSPLNVHAQTGTPAKPDVIFSWKAQNYYPSDYSGKALPTANTSVTISAEFLLNNVVQDTRKTLFTWYVNERVIERGTGLKEIRVPIRKDGKSEYFVRLIVSASNTTFETSTVIPIVPYSVVLDTPYPNLKASPESVVRIQAIPYFFNIDSLNNLKFVWEVNGMREIREGNNQIAINVGGLPENSSRNSIQIEVIVQNVKNLLEFATKKISVFIQ